MRHPHDDEALHLSAVATVIHPLTAHTPVVVICGLAWARVRLGAFAWATSAIWAAAGGGGGLAVSWEGACGDVNSTRRPTRRVLLSSRQLHL